MQLNLNRAVADWAHLQYGGGLLGFRQGFCKRRGGAIQKHGLHYQIGYGTENLAVETRSVAALTSSLELRRHLGFI